MATLIFFYTATCNAVIHAPNRRDRPRSARSVPSREFDRDSVNYIIIINDSLITCFLMQFDKAERRASSRSLDDSGRRRPVLTFARFGSIFDKRNSNINVSLYVENRTIRIPT